MLLIGWELEGDTFAVGQWLNGRVYEDRCDLSPSGDLLLYFAADQHPPYYTWTAISRPPFLTALALWPKGDTYGGGGLFLDETTVALDHLGVEPKLADDFALPDWLGVRQFHRDASKANSVWAARIRRDGWELTSAPGQLVTERRGDSLARWDPPQVWEKRDRCGQHVLRMTQASVSKTRAWYVPKYELVHGSSIESLGELEWADWDRSGDLLFSREGALYRRRHDDGDAQVIADFSPLRFEALAPSSDAKLWPAR